MHVYNKTLIDKNEEKLLVSNSFKYYCKPTAGTQPEKHGHLMSAAKLRLDLLYIIVQIWRQLSLSDTFIL